MHIIDNPSRCFAIIAAISMTILTISGCASNNTSDNTETINANARTVSSNDEVIFTVNEEGNTVIQTQPLEEKGTIDETEDEEVVEPTVESDEATPSLDSPKNATSIPDNVTVDQLQSAFEMDDESAKAIAALPENERRQAVYDYAEESPLFDVDYEDEDPSVLSPYAGKCLTVIGDGEDIETQTLTFDTLMETKNAYDDLCAKYGEDRIIVESKLESFVDEKEIPDLSDEEWEKLFADVDVEEVAYDGETFTEEISIENFDEENVNVDVTAEDQNVLEDKAAVLNFEADDTIEIEPGTENEYENYATTTVGTKNSSLASMNLPASANLLEACTVDTPVTIAIIEMDGINSDHNASSHVTIDSNSANVGADKLTVPYNKMNDYAYYYEKLSYKSATKAGTSNYKYWKDTDGHGTAVLSVVAAGVPKGTKILLIKPKDKTNIFDEMACFKYARDKGAKVVNTSWGFPIEKSRAQVLGLYNAMMKDYEKNKIMLVAAAGNDNANLETSKKLYCPPGISNAVTVAAVDSSKKRASFSNYGNAIEFAAPGMSLTVADKKSKNAYRISNGTSFAAPAVAAFAANLYSLYPNKTRAQIQNLMQGMSKDLGSKGWDKYYGYGFPVFNLSKIPFSITYGNLNGLKAPSQTSYNTNSAVTLSNPSGTRKGYTFIGWYTSTSSSGTKITKIAKGSKGNIKVYARFTANTYNIAFNANSGKGTMTEQKMTYDKTAVLSANKFTRTGYTFTGWNTKANGKGTAYKDKASVKNLAASGKVTLYAQWAAKSYSIAFNANGGKGSMAKQKMTYGKAAALSPNKFTRNNYTFAGWNTKADGTGTTYKNKASVKNLASSGTVTLYAKWAGNSYSITFNANGGTGTMAAQKMTYGTASTLNANKFAKSGYTFNGWNTKADGKGTTYKDKASVKNLATSGKVTLYAMWKAGSPTTTPTTPSNTTKMSIKTGWTAYDANNNVMTVSYVASGFNTKPIKYIKNGSQRLDVGKEIEISYIHSTTSKTEFALIKGTKSYNNITDAFVVLYKVK